jgi:hypothetical protein
MISYGEKDCVSCEWWIGFTMIHPDLLDLTNALHPNFAKLQVGHLQHKDLDEPLLAAQPPVLPHSKGPQASLTPCSPSRLERLDKFLEQNVHRRRHVPDVFCTVGHGNQSEKVHRTGAEVYRPSTTWHIKSSREIASELSVLISSQMALKPLMSMMPQLLGGAAFMLPGTRYYKNL